MSKLSKVLLGIAVAMTTLLTFFTTNRANVVKAASPMHSVISIDAGRKYFSLSQLKEIVDRAEKNGFTDLQLMLSNDAMRFMLDDMTVVANGKTYASDDVKAALAVGNDNYYNDPNGDYLTEAEMNELISYAASKHISLIPAINSPGHMDAILDAMSELGINNPSFNQSKRTVDLNNDEAVAFTKAFVQKYVTYFAGKVNWFNFGCDEYANDVDTGGWAKLQQSGAYSKFVAYVNGLAAMAKANNMRPVVFNDGIYYNNETSFGTFDQSLIISYWTVGWGGYDVAKPDFFTNKGYSLLNTNDGWYYVIGRETNDDGIYPFQNAMAAINKKTFDDVTGATTTLPIIGSTQAVWADAPQNEYSIDKVGQLMDQFGSSYAESMNPIADYHQLDAVLKTLPADLDIYTDQTVAPIQAAQANIVRNLRRDQQATVDGYAQKLAQLIKGLTLKPADYRTVDQLITHMGVRTKTWTSGMMSLCIQKQTRKELSSSTTNIIIHGVQ